MAGSFTAQYHSANTGSSTSKNATVSGASTSNHLIAFIFTKNNSASSQSFNSVTGYNTVLEATSSANDGMSLQVVERKPTGDSNDNITASWSVNSRSLITVLEIPDVDSVTVVEDSDTDTTNQDTTTKSQSCGTATATSAKTYYVSAVGVQRPSNWASHTSYPSTDESPITATETFDEDYYYALANSNPSIFVGIRQYDSAGDRTNTFSTTRAAIRTIGVGLILKSATQPSGGNVIPPPLQGLDKQYAAITAARLGGVLQ